MKNEIQAQKEHLKEPRASPQTGGEEEANRRDGKRKGSGDGKEGGAGEGKGRKRVHMRGKQV